MLKVVGSDYRGAPVIARIAHTDDRPYAIRDDVPIPRLPHRGSPKSAHVVDDPLYHMMLDMEPGQSFVAPWEERARIGNYIQAIRGRAHEMMFITRKLTRSYRGRIILKVGVWRV